MKTALVLLAQYDGAAIVPLEHVCRDYFTHLTVEQFARKATEGEIDIPIVRIDGSSRKSAKGIHVHDLAAWIDARRAAAIKENNQMHGRKPLQFIA